MTSEFIFGNIKEPTECYVWTWLPNESKPMVCGIIENIGNKFFFTYAKSYLAKQNAISLNPDELPLIAERQSPLAGLNMPGCLRDGSPDSWGRRIILQRLFGKKQNIKLDPSEIVFLLESHSNRPGALDFQTSSHDYIERTESNSTLEELLTASERIQTGEVLSPQLLQALLHGTSLGGARPKAMIQSDTNSFIAKFSSTQDHQNVVKLEFIAMKLAKKAGIDAAEVSWKRVLGKDVLLVKRFDRDESNNQTLRKSFLSALTLLKLDELQARYASYEDFAEILRKRSVKPKDTLRELFARLTFNILCGNNDDHARNHAVFWNGKNLSLTPAYDICPQGRPGNEQSQAMLIVGQDRRSKIETCLNGANQFMLSRKSASEIVSIQIASIKLNWNSVCEECELSNAEKKLASNRQFLNPYCLEGTNF